MWRVLREPKNLDTQRLGYQGDLVNGKDDVITPRQIAPRISAEWTVAE